MEAELRASDTATVEAEWLQELPMDLPIVEKPIPPILMDCDNQTMIVKVNSSKDNMKSSRHVKKAVEICQEIEKLRSYCLGLCSNGEEPGRSIHKGSITKCDRQCILGIGHETHVSHSIMITYSM